MKRWWSENPGYGGQFNEKNRKRGAEKYRELKADGGPEYELRLARARAYGEKNRYKITVAARNWRKQHPERAREFSRTYWRKDNPRKAADSLRRKREHKEKLTDGYVRRRICNTGGTTLRAADVPQELVDLERARIQLERKLDESKDIG